MDEAALRKLVFERRRCVVTKYVHLHVSGWTVTLGGRAFGLRRWGSEDKPVRGAGGG